MSVKKHIYLPLLSLEEALRARSVVVEPDALLPQFRQIIRPTQVSGLSMTLPNGIRIGLDGMSMEDLSHLLVNMGRHA